MTTTRFSDVADHTVPRQQGWAFTSPNKLKLGVFAANLSGGASSITSYTPGPPEMSNFDEPRRIAQAADNAGFEALVPIARWKGFGGESRFWDRTYETFAWGAALAEATKRIQIFTTTPIPIYHPVLAAKLGATLDHIAGGRWGLNIVAGWHREEFEMFGIELGDHAARYRYADEWTALLNRLWAEDKEFDHKGEFFNLKGAISLPHPVQAPRPAIMNAGGSPAGLNFAVHNADMIYINFADTETMEGNIKTIRNDAAQLGRRVAIWGAAWILCRPTQEECDELIRTFLDEQGDFEAGSTYMKKTLGSDTASQETYRKDPEILRRLMLNAGHYPIIGTPETVVAELKRLSEAGIDGIALSWLNYEEGIKQYTDELFPLLQEAGLRSEAPVGDATLIKV